MRGVTRAEHIADEECRPPDIICALDPAERQPRGPGLAGEAARARRALRGVARGAGLAPLLAPLILVAAGGAGEAVRRRLPAPRGGGGEA